MALVSDERRSGTVAALEEAEAFSLYRENFNRLRRQYPSVDSVLFAFLAGEFAPRTSACWKRSTRRSSGACALERDPYRVGANRRRIAIEQLPLRPVSRMC